MEIYCKGYGLNCKDCEKEKCIDSRGKAKDHSDIVYPAIYRHFKHTDDGIQNNYMYATLLKSKPKELSKDEMLNAEEKIIAKFTEADRMEISFKIEGVWYLRLMYVMNILYSIKLCIVTIEHTQDH